MPEPGGLPWIPANFLALPEEQSGFDRAGAVLIPAPYDSTTSFRTGARYGPAAMIEASGGLEDYDWELELDVSQVGIFTSARLEPHMGGPGLMVERVREAVGHYARSGKLVGVLGGEHSITIGAVRAFYEIFPQLSVLYLDAHADLRDEYMGTPFGHASGARRVQEMCGLVLVGVRSLCLEERQFIRSRGIPVFFWPPETQGKRDSYLEEIVDCLGPEVYVSVDLDVLDPSIMAAVGTPEPGGMTWQEIMSVLRRVAESRRIVGFDVCELSPEDGPPACAYTAAKLVYKLVAYGTLKSG